jgi:CubicO group peptidase (beta-lactamase class C family)
MSARDRFVELVNEWSPGAAAAALRIDPATDVSESAALAHTDSTSADAADAGVAVLVDAGDDRRRHRVASLTKLMVAMATWIAVEEGSLAWDTPAGPSGSTVAHLLAHASGLPFDGDVPIAAPTQRRIYSNTGYQILGDTLAAATGISWQEYVQEAVLEPLGMADTSLDGPASHGAMGNLADLVRFAAELARPTLIAGQTYELVTSPAWPELAGVLPGFGKQRPCWWGLGPELHGTKSPHWMPATAGPNTFGHFGGSGSLLWIDLDRGVGLVGLGDRPFDRWAVDLWPRLGEATFDLLG